MKEANKIAENIIDISDINVFKNTRKREYIEVRSLLTFMLRHHCNFTYHQIKDFYRLNGKSYDHATAIHSLKAFETHRRFSSTKTKKQIQIKKSINKPHNRLHTRKGLKETP